MLSAMWQDAFTIDKLVPQSILIFFLLIKCIESTAFGLRRVDVKKLFNINTIWEFAYVLSIMFNILHSIILFGFWFRKNLQFFLNFVYRRVCDLKLKRIWFYFLIRS